MNEPTQLPAHIRAVVVKPIGTQPQLRVHATFFDASTGVLTVGVTLNEPTDPAKAHVSILRKALMKLGAEATESDWRIIREALAATQPDGRTPYRFIDWMCDGELVRGPEPESDRRFGLHHDQQHVRWYGDV